MIIKLTLMVIIIIIFCQNMRCEQITHISLLWPWTHKGIKWPDCLVVFYFAYLLRFFGWYAFILMHDSRLTRTGHRFITSVAIICLSALNIQNGSLHQKSSILNLFTFQSAFSSALQGSTINEKVSFSKWKPFGEWIRDHIRAETANK